MDYAWSSKLLPVWRGIFNISQSRQLSSTIICYYSEDQQTNLNGRRSIFTECKGYANEPSGAIGVQINWLWEILIGCRLPSNELPSNLNLKNGLLR